MSTYSNDIIRPAGVPKMSMHKFVLFIDGSVATAALSDPTPTNTKPATQAMDVSNYSAVRLMFGGTGAGGTVNYQVIGWKWVESGHGTAAEADAWWPEVLAKGVATLGTDVYAATNIGAGTELIADTITDTIGMPGRALYSPADNTRAVIEVPTRGSMVLTVEVDLGTATATDVFVQLGEASTQGAPMLAGINIFTATGKSVTDLEFLSIAQAGAGVTTIHADDAGHHFYLMGYQGSMTGAGTIQFREADDAPVYDGAMNLGANGGFGVPVTGFPLCVTASGKGLELVSVGAGFNGMVQFLDITE